ncbi:MAG: hypothetical protein ACE5H9_20375 [Anaerolineae bacterium]
MIMHTCFRCGRRFELDPIFVGVELSKLKKKNPSHYKAHCPACQATNKVSVREMKDDLEAVADEIQAAVVRLEEEKARQKAAKKKTAAKARSKTG